ncbi:DnaJ domain-containing protein [Rhodoferax sp.]|uniref:J domain-containing protein n=1 Tax=Rhodoferax sp. TaxID=50421 RepID=UPI00261C22DD|nr:DnaJ domain-containing protein [Rhodoferax sp.]MDD2920245.1 DnaJ domain-containing protein [Rhodoferax sp.]
MSTDLRRAAPAGEVIAALLDFEQSPGRYPVVIREPRILFEQAGLVLMLAAGRQPDGLAAEAMLEPGVRRSARFFVRTVMLRPGVDFYTLLGVQQSFDAEVLREHYRLMIRMTHPDFVASGESWPADAAARINQAHDVMVSAVKREGYRATLDGARAWPAPRPVAAHGQRPRARVAVANGRWPAFRTLAVSAAVVLLALTALVMSWPSSDEGLLTLAARAPLVLAVLPKAGQADSAQASEMPVAGPARVALDAAAKPVTPARAVAWVPAVAPDVPAPEVPVRELFSAATVVANAPDAPSTRLVIEPPPSVKTPELVAPNITMDQVQPLLTNVLQSLQSGRGDHVLQWLEPSSRQSDAATRFVAAYNQSLAGSRVTGLGTVRFTSRFDAGQLVVDGMVQLLLVDERQQASRQDVRLRAYFFSRDSAPVLTRMEAF